MNMRSHRLNFLLRISIKLILKQDIVCKNIRMIHTSAQGTFILNRLAECFSTNHFMLFFARLIES